MGVRRLTHLGICVANLDRALRFYRDALGFAEVGRFHDREGFSAPLLEIADVRLSAVYLERDGWRIELLYYDRPGAIGSDERRPMNQLGLTHLSFVVEDLDQTVEEIRRCGGKIVDTSRMEMGARAIFATDPDGTRLELIQRDGDPLAIPGQ